MVETIWSVNNFFFSTSGPEKKTLYAPNLIIDLAKKKSSILLLLNHLCNIINQLLLIQFVFSFFL